MQSLLHGEDPEKQVKPLAKQGFNDDAGVADAERMELSLWEVCITSLRYVSASCGPTLDPKRQCCHPMFMTPVSNTGSSSNRYLCDPAQDDFGNLKDR